MSINWRELKAAFLALQAFLHLTHTTVLIRTDNTTSLAYINKQGGTKSFSLMTLATTLWKWYTQLRSGLRVKKIFYKKSLASETRSVQQPPSVSMGSSRGGSVCRQDKQPPRKVRVVETRSRSMEDRCLHHSLEQSTESVRQPPPLEPHLALPRENSERESPSNHTGGTLLAVGNLVPSATTSGSSSSSFPVPHRHTVRDKISPFFGFFAMPRRELNLGLRFADETFARKLDKIIGVN
ncbi:hypothetical protein G6F24_013922 [Rhizopus arrhizus]|nr:hypothetical protein G6F24_013922 [Rhizopus arrhizus]